MKFGPCPLAQAEGALLAHSLHLQGRKLRKGHCLSAEDIAALQEAGHDSLTVARPEPGDVLENEAAQRVAMAAHGGAGGLHCTLPFTGRVNLIADAPGVVVLDTARITGVNRIDPMITLATVPPFHQIHPKGLIATVKIISYAVPDDHVLAAVKAVRGAIRLAQPVYRTASLIVTEIPDGPGLKGQQAIADRLTGLGMELTETLSCPHKEDALAQALRAATGDLVLILTGSATSDVKDTAPEALKYAGGHLQRFGMPVDPGNLLFLGQLGARPVIGLPGSARSPVLHGADWVLSRVACGLDISDEDFAAMGVGGLLKEIPTRPQPRHRPAR